MKIATNLFIQLSTHFIAGSLSFAEAESFVIAKILASEFFGVKYLRRELFLRKHV